MEINLSPEAAGLLRQTADDLDLSPEEVASIMLESNLSMVLQR